MAIELYEPYDSKIWNIIKRGKDKLPDGQYPILKTWVDNQKDGFVKVIYSDNREGRLSHYLDNDKHSGISLGTMWNKVRSSFVSGKLRDYDIENCHPDIIRQLAKKHKIKCDVLIDYCLDRESYYESYGKGIKKRVISWINGGAYSEKDDDLIDLYNQVNNIMMQLIKHSPSYKEIQSITDIRVRNKKLRSLRAIYSQDLEKKVLLSMYNVCLKNNVKVGCLIYDGMMVYSDTVPSNFISLLEANVKLELKFNIKIVEKPIPPFNPLDWTDELVVDDDSQAVDLFLTLYPNLVKCRGLLYILKDNLWIGDDDYIKKLIMRSGIRKAGRKLSVAYSSNKSGCINIFDSLKIQLDDDPNFITNMNESTLGYVFYKNGYYDLKQNKFINKLDKSTLIRIERDYIDNGYHKDHKYVKDIYNRLFDCLGDKELIEYFCIAVSRAIGGFFVDKVGYVLTGQRNSGKGTLNACLDLVFERYVTTIPPPITKSQVSDTKTNAFLIDKKCDLARISYSNEGISKDGKVTLDGNLLKAMCSGGDKIPCRTNYTNTSDVINNTTLFLSFNQVPKADPADALATFKIFPFPYSYKAKPNPKLKYEKIAFDIKTYIKNTKYFISVFEWIIFNSFTSESISSLPTPDKCEIEKDIIEDENICDFSACFNKYLDVDEDAFVRASELHFLFTSKLKLSAIKVSRLMNEAGYKKVRKSFNKSQLWVYIGLTIKPDEFEDDEFEEDDEY
jgi:hypothetical protein